MRVAALACALVFVSAGSAALAGPYGNPPPAKKPPGRPVMPPPTIPRLPHIPPRPPPKQTPSQEILDLIPEPIRSQAADALGDPVGTDFVADPSLSLTDKVILLMAVVVQEHEREIEADMQKIMSLSEGGSEGGLSEDGSDGSLSVASMKLQRKIDTLEQFETIIRGLIEKLSRMDDDAARSIAR